MKKTLGFLTSIYMMLNPATLFAWQPSGWVWFAGPNAYDHGNEIWYYFSETDSQYYQDWGTGEWKSITTASGWHYFDWPWSYSWDSQEWNYWSETDLMYVMDWTRGDWSRFGEAISNGSDDAPGGMARIPAGWFAMGEANNDPSSDAPLVNVYVSEFYMARHQVTLALWNDVRNWALQNGYTDIGTTEGKGANHPAHSVNWWDAVKWLNARSEREGLDPVYRNTNGTVFRTGTTAPNVNWNANGYRLPTEAEWEKAARGGTPGQRFPWGNEINHDHANYLANGFLFTYDTSPYTSFTPHPSFDQGFGPYTSPVGSFTANGYGLYDMVGNVWEWCWDRYSLMTYTDGAIDPKGPTWETYTSRVLRGGSASLQAFFNRTAFRYHGFPQDGFNVRGFRPARSSVP